VHVFISVMSLCLLKAAVDTSKAVEIAIAAVKHQAEIDKQRIMAQADLKCKEEIQRAKREMESRMLKAQQANVDHQPLSVSLYVNMFILCSKKG